MTDLNIVHEDPTTHISPYASRIRARQWQAHEATIRDLFELGHTRKEILAKLWETGFRPSFGQLVAQMTRWRLVRYLKPGCAPEPRLPDATIKQPQGILAIVSQLITMHHDDLQTLSTNPSVPSLTPRPSSKHDSLPGYHDFPTLLQNLSLDDHIRQQQLPQPRFGPSREQQQEWSASTLPVSSPNSVIPAYCSPALEFAEICFVGQCYNEAFASYLTFAESTMATNASQPLADPISLVIAALGCLKSYTTPKQQTQAFQLVERSKSRLISSTQPSNVSPPTPPRSPPPSSSSQAHHTLTLLNALDSTYAALSPSNAHTTSLLISRSWLSLRLQRLPSWSSAILASLPSPTNTTPSPTPLIRNIIPALHYLQHTIPLFSPLFNTQLTHLWPWARHDLNVWKSLLLWRLIFASKFPHDPPPNTTPRNSVHRTCPNLAIDLSPVQTCSSALSTVETLAVVVELVFEGVELEETSLVEPHEHVLAFVRRKLRLDMGGHLGSEAWEVMARVLCPSGGARGGGLTSGRDGSRGLGGWFG